MNEPKKPGLYVHVPFCKSKCHYCDFYSVTSQSLVTSWLEAVGQEAFLYRDRFGVFDTLYLGGGTPSSLTDHELATLVESIYRYFSFSADVEFTLEANPDDMSPERLIRLGDLGINRISLGAQSFHQSELNYLGRRNSTVQNEQVLGWVRSSGAFSLAVDLIYGFAGQTRDSWVESMDRVLQFYPEHLSCYQLTIEEKTPFGRLRDKGLMKEIDENEASDLFLLTSEYLEASGYLHYEISNFAQSLKHRSRHNRKYWQHVPYLGVGPAAHSFENGVRWWNIRSVEGYIGALQNGRRPAAGSEVLSAEQLQLESVYLGLRTREGISRAVIGEPAHGQAILQQLQAAGLVTLVDGDVIPTRQGFLVADSLPLLLL
jgi:oxygen-independent coproporphyrinogen III oxidase